MSTAPPPSGGQEQTPPQGYDQQPTGARPTNGLAIAALVCGLLSVPLFITIVGGILLGLVAIVLGVLGLNRAKKTQNSGKGMAITGIVSGALGLILSVAAIAGLSFLGQQIEEDPEGFQQQLEEQIGTELPTDLGT